MTERANVWWRHGRGQDPTMSSRNVSLSTASCRCSPCAGATATRASGRSSRTSTRTGSSAPRARRRRTRRRRRREEHATRLLDELGYVGVLALELFDVGGTLLANEFAPRVHNTGHWTIEGAVTSQFENHLRAVLGLPLGSTESRAVAAMVNLIGAVPTDRGRARDPRRASAPLRQGAAAGPEARPRHARRAEPRHRQPRDARRCVSS